MKKLHFNKFLFFKHLSMVFIALSLVACAYTTPQYPALKQTAERYFDVYAARSDFDQFMTFYADNAELRDIVYGNYLQNKQAIRDFLDWDKGNFSLVSGEKILTVTQQTLQANVVVTQGYFHAFKYNGDQLGPWLFNITLEFDETGKIIKQTDWINYTPRDKFIGGENMNERLIGNIKDNR